jgi:phage/conjugal plasmid C-4 type zinc finger TraR family protein
MADDADHAQRVIEADLERRIAAARGVVATGESATECRDCGAQIPEGRRLAVPGVTRCSWCQQQVERGARR